MATRKNSVVTEIGIFAIGLPIIIGAIVLALSHARSGPPGPPAMGIERGVFIAAPILAACGLTMVCGVLLLITRSVWAVITCVVGASLISVSYLVVFAILGALGINLITAVMIAIPALLIVRSRKAVSELRVPSQERGDRCRISAGREAHDDGRQEEATDER